MRNFLSLNLELGVSLDLVNCKVTVTSNERPVLQVKLKGVERHIKIAFLNQGGLAFTLFKI